MIGKRPNLFMAVFLLLGCLMGLVLGCIGGMAVGKVPEVEEQSSTHEEKPVRLITITITPSQQERLFAQLQEFGETWRYAVLIAPKDQDNEVYVVQFWRLDMKMTGLYSSVSGILELGFYNTNPDGRNPWWFFDDELKELEGLINEIPGSTYSVEK